MSKVIRGIIGVGLIALAIIQPEFAPFITSANALGIGLFGASLALGAVLEKSFALQNRLQAQSVMVRSAVQPQEILYGRDKKSGVVVYYDTTGTENEYLWFVIAVVEHEIDAYETLWIDDIAIDIATEIDGSNMVTNSYFVDADSKQLVKAVFYTGAPGQVADPDLVAAFASWTTSHIGSGVAYFYVRCELDKSEGGNDPDNPTANVWHKGYPREIAVTARGAKVYDSRLDSTNGGTGTHRADDSTTWEWSNNPVLCRTDYLRSSRFGPGYLSTEMDWTVFAAQATIADQTVSIPGSTTQTRYTLNGVVTVADTPKAVTETMQSADHGITLFLPAGIQPRVGGWDASSWTIDETWLAGPMNVTSSLSMDTVYNAVRGQYLSAAENYTMIEFQARTSSAYETEDGVGRVWQDVTLPFTDEEYTAQRLAIIQLKKSRQQTSVQLQCNFRAELIQPFQVVTLSLPGFSSDTFRVLNKTSPTSGIITLDLREEVSTDWDYTVPDMATPPVVVGVTRGTAVPPPPTALATASVSGGVFLTWTLPAMADVSYIEVYAATTNDRATAVLVARTMSESVMHALAEGSTRYYWILSRGKNGLVSTWEPVSATGGVVGTAEGVGKSIFVGSVYLRKPTTPTEPVTDDGSYAFDTNTLTPPSIAGGSADDWSITIPAGDDDLYVSNGTFEVTGALGTDSTVDWTAPVKLVTTRPIEVPDITPGFVGGTSDFIYTLNMLKTDVPNDGEIKLAGTTFNHPDGTVVTTVANPLQINTKYESTTTGKFYIMYTATLPTTRFGGVSGDWSNPESHFCVMTYDDTNGWRARGNDGTYYAMTVVATDCIVAVCQKTVASGGINTLYDLTGGLFGNSIVVANCYKRSASAPSTPTGGSYDFSSTTLTPPSGWSDTVPSGTDPLYVSSAAAEAVGTGGVDSSLTWSTPVIMASDGVDAVQYYIKALTGTAIKNSSGTLTVEAHMVTGSSDVLLSSGTIQLYVGSTLVNVANGYATGSDGYTGVFDSGDISGGVVVELKDGAGGTKLDTITLVDITDGGDAVWGYIEPSAPLAWTLDTDQTTWTPTATTVDLDCTFVQAGADVARQGWRITRSSSGILTGASTTHPSGDLNTGRITVTELNESSQAMTVKFAYSYSSDAAAVAETVITSMTGSTPVSVSLSNQSQVIPADIEGFNYTTYVDTNTYISNTDGDFEVMQGDTDLTGTINDMYLQSGADGWTTTGQLQTQTLNGAIFEIDRDTGHYRVKVSGTNSYRQWTSDTESVTLQVTVNSIVYKRSFTISKSKSGVSESVQLNIRPWGYNDGIFDYDGGLRLHSNSYQKVITGEIGGTPTWSNDQLWRLSGSSSDYEVNVTFMSGDALDTASSYDTWLALSTTRSWYYNGSSAKQCTLKVDIRRASSGQVLVSEIVVATTDNNPV